MEHLLAMATRYEEEHPNHGIAIMGDLNARMQSAHDHRWTPRGRILQHNLPEDWTIHCEGPTMQTHDLHTSCVDYILLSATAKLTLPLCETHAFNLDSDHAPLSLHIYVEDPIEAEPEPLPYHRPPPPPPHLLQQIDHQEEALLRNTVKDTSYRKAFNFRPDTSKLNRLRKKAQKAAAQLQLNRTPLNIAIHRIARNKYHAEHKRIQAQRRRARTHYMQSLTAKEWTEQAKPLLRGKRDQTILASGQQIETHYRKLLKAPEPTEIPGYNGDEQHPNLFTDPFTEEEVKNCVKKLRNSATGEDRVTAHEIRQLDTTTLTNHLNTVISEQTIPAKWKRSILVTIPKGSAANSKDPANTRGIALQSAMRKLFTLLLSHRLQEHIEDTRVLPDLQNGFRQDHRTADNIFILRTLQEKALQHKKPLIIAQIDIKKVLPPIPKPPHR